MEFWSGLIWLFSLVDDELYVFVRDFLLPLALTVVTSGVAVATVFVSLRHSNRLQRAEREAGERARMDEAYRGAAENVLVALAVFVGIDSADPTAGLRISELRARVKIFQSVTRGQSQDAVGEWLGLECEQGMHLFMQAIRSTSHLPTGSVLHPEYRAAMAVPNGWASQTVVNFVDFLRPPINDEWVRSRSEFLIGDNEARRNGFIPV